MPSPLATDLQTLLLAIENKLISDGVYSHETCYIGLQPNPVQVPPSDQYAVIAPGRFVDNQPITRGAGRTCLFVEGEFFVYLWSRLILDEYPRDDSYLTDSALGALGKLKCVINSLHMFQPLDLHSNQEIAEPMRLADYDFTPREQAPGWGLIRTRWLMNYQQQLSCP